MTEEELISEIEAALLHYGVKGMKWGVRKNTIHRKFRPLGQTEKGKIQVQRRGVAGKLPVVGRKRTLSNKKTQRTIDELGLNVKWNEVRKRDYDRVRIGEEIMQEMTKRYYQDRQTMRDNKAQYKREKKQAKKDAAAQKKAEKEAAKAKDE